jgi:hypothetical protein
MRKLWKATFFVAFQSNRATIPSHFNQTVYLFKPSGHPKGEIIRLILLAAIADYLAIF